MIALECTAPHVRHRHIEGVLEKVSSDGSGSGTCKDAKIWILVELGILEHAKYARPSFHLRPPLL